MLPGLSNVLRRDKEKQRAAAAGLESIQSPSQYASPSLPNSSVNQQSSTDSNFSNPLLYSTQNSMSPRSKQQQASTTTRTAAQHIMLPEEHRAREKEKEKLARAQLGNSYTQQVMANRQLQQNLAPSREQQMQGSAQSRYSSQHMESSVTRLLVATKMLLEALTKWSLGQKTETQVSDIYVRLGNDFNVANVAFGSYGIDMSDLLSVPDDLRVCLERCLSEDPSPQTLEIHLPRIREIIIGLLQGLKAKQAEYKQYLVQSRASARLSKSRNDRATASEEVQSSMPSQATEAEAFKRASSTGASTYQPFQNPEGVRRSLLNQGGKRPTHAPPLETTLEKPSAETERLSDKPSPSREDSFSSLRSAEESEADVDSSTPVKRKKKSNSRRSSKNKVGDGEAVKRSDSRGQQLAEADGEEEETMQDATIDKQGRKLYSLTDQGAKPADGDDTVSHALPPSASYSTPSRRELGNTVHSGISHSAPRQGSYLTDDAVNEMGDAADPSVRALKSRDALERRASKRFSAYTFNKMGVGLNQGMGMSSYALSGVAGGGSSSALSSPLLDRKDHSSKLSGSGRRGLTRASSDAPTSERDYYSQGSLKTHKGRILSSEDVMEETKSTDAFLDTPLKRPNSVRKSKTSPGPSPRGGSTLKLGLPPTGSHMSQAASSTESLPFVDADSPDVVSPQRNVVDLKDEALAAPSRLSRDPVPPVPPLPSVEERARLSALQMTRSSSGATKYASPSTRTSNASMGYGGSSLPTPVPPSTSFPPSTMSGQGFSNGSATNLSLFLQLGRQTRKANLDIDPNLPFKGLSIGKLRMLFMDKFSYSPGKEDFPAIYLKDVGSGVTFELEDLSDLTDGSVVTLNIEPLDQVKQHLDLSLGTITRELRELKLAFNDRERDMNRRLSATAPTTNSEVVASPATLKISDAQFAMAGARVAQFKQATMQQGKGEPRDVSSPTLSTSTPGYSESSNWRVAGVQIKQQYDEVQKLRRHLAIINQIQGEFKSEVGGLLGALREQTNKVKSIAASEVPTERNFIIAGKSRLDASSQEILTLVEDLLDAVDDLKADVIQRGVKPKPNTMKQLQQDIARATKGLEDLSNYVETVKPSWKKTWELELQNIVDEQEFLNHQEGLIGDLKEDHYSLQEVFQNIQEVVKLRGANKYTLTAGSNNGSDPFLGGVALRSYIPPAPEEGHEGLTTVMMEVKTQSVDHERRLKALQAAERQRQKELSQRKGGEDEFQSELTTFVDGKILRKTGGYQETERVRSRRDKMTMQAMFSGGANIVGGAPVDVNASPPPKKLSLPKPDSLSGGEAAGSSE